MYILQVGLHYDDVGCSDVAEFLEAHEEGAELLQTGDGQRADLVAHHGRVGLEEYHSLFLILVHL